MAAAAAAAAAAASFPRPPGRPEPSGPGAAQHCAASVCCVMMTCRRPGCAQRGAVGVPPTGRALGGCCRVARGLPCVGPARAAAARVSPQAGALRGFAGAHPLGRRAAAPGASRGREARGASMERPVSGGRATGLCSTTSLADTWLQHCVMLIAARSQRPGRACVGAGLPRRDERGANASRWPRPEADLSWVSQARARRLVTTLISGLLIYRWHACRGLRAASNRGAVESRRLGFSAL